jgi:hypothetical protein
MWQEAATGSSFPGEIKESQKRTLAVPAMDNDEEKPKSEIILYQTDARR